MKKIKLILFLLSVICYAQAQVNVSIVTYGGNGNGIADNFQAFQDAEDYVYSHGGGEIFVPAGVYVVLEPFYHRSHVTLRGVGATTIIRNTLVSGSGDEQWCIHIGNFAPSTFGECLHFDVKDITAGTRKIKFITPAEVSNFTVGEAVLIDTEDGFISTDEQLKPYQAFINRITAIDAVKGVITVEDYITTNILHAKMASTRKFNIGVDNDTSKVYICQEPIIKNIRFESLGNWTMRFGCYKGIFKNISLKTADVIPGNGLAYCTFKNITAEFSQKVIEMAMYSHNTKVDGLTATWWNGAVDTDLKPLIEMGENVRDCIYQNMNIDAGSGLYFGDAIRFAHAFNNQITSSTFNCLAVQNNAVEMETSNPASIVTGNLVSGNTFTLDEPGSFIRLENSITGAILSNNTVINNIFNGYTDTPVRLIGNVNNNVTSPNIYQ